MSATYSVALQGFSSFERDAMKAYLRLATGRSPRYRWVASPSQADFLVADADRPDAVQAVIDAGRAHDTVFVGHYAPESVTMRLPRPVNPVLILRELDACVALRDPMQALGEMRPSAEQVPVLTSVVDGPRMHRERRLRFELPERFPPLDVLIVDDSEVSLRFLGRMVEGLGLKPTLASSSEEALQALGRTRFFLVLIDVLLGEESEFDGLALCRHIKREAAPGTLMPYVAMVTGNDQSAQRVLADLAGCDAYLTKPVDENDLRAAINRALPAVPTSRMRRPVERRQ